MLEYYNKIDLENNCILSCDMLRLSFKMNEEKALKFNKFILSKTTFDNSLDMKNFFNLQQYKYRNLITITKTIGLKKISFAMGIGFNGSLSEKQSCFIEFNPNKTMDIVMPFLNFIKSNSFGLTFVRCDMAIDIPISKNMITISKDSRKLSRIYRYDLHSKDLNNCTEYLGCRSNNGFVKLYNKQIESNLDYVLTRLEITLDSLEYKNFQKCMPNIHFLKNINLCDMAMLNDTDRVLMLLLLESDKPYDLINMLGRGKKEKIKSLLSDNNNELFDITFYLYMQFVLNIKNIIEN